MDNEIKLKLATLDDLPAMIEVGDLLFDYSIKPDRASEFLNDPRHHLILAYDETDIVGMASGFHYIHPDKDPVLFIDEAGVIDEFQGKGIGKTLIKRMIEQGKTMGCVEAWVTTEQSNAAARKAYAGAGGVERTNAIIIVEFLKSN